MSLNRFAKKRDSAEPAIIDALERAGFHVWQRDEPDLLVRKDGWAPGVMQGLEVKSTKRKRYDQPGQDAFLRATGTPVVRTPLEALRVLGVVT